MRSFIRLSTSGRTLRAALFAFSGIAIASSCTENLPSGPNTFPATLAIVVPHDTIVIGDSSSAAAKATDGAGRQIQNLTFGWTSTDTSIVGFSAADSSNGRFRKLVAKKTGRASVSLSLPDPRFAGIVAVTRSEVGVVGGVKILTSKDSTLTSVNDTAIAVAAGLVRANGTLVTRVSTGTKWLHLGQHVTIAGQGDTIRYIAQANGPDTLIATNDFCLLGAKCADTVFARVAQVVTLTLSTHSFSSWSFADSVGPAITLADKRGNGLPGSSIHFVPATAADSALVKVSAIQGTSNPATGEMASPKLITAGNGTAKAYVKAIGADGVSVVATDSITVVVRQVARRAAIEPLRAVMTSNDSIPIRPVARDARGAPIADATVTVTSAGISLNGIWAVVSNPSSITGPTFATIAPTITGIALPSSNPSAPQVDVKLDTAAFTLLKADTVTASDTATRPTSVVLLDSTAVALVGGAVNFAATGGAAPASATADGLGQVSMVWMPPDTVGTTTPNPLGFYTLIGVRSAAVAPLTSADSVGRIVIRRSILVKADTSSALRSTVSMSATTLAVNATATVTVVLRDRFNNVYKLGAPGDFTVMVSASGGAVGAFTCTNGVCTATYTAPATGGTFTLNATINNSSNPDMLFSPITLTINN